jgi:N,N'-diacetyllegionaminate synthase
MKADAMLWDRRVFIIAEAGVNHNGSLDLAKKLIDVAKESGADAVKFQTWKPGEIIGKYAVKVTYLEDTVEEDESFFELVNRLCLPYNVFAELQSYADHCGILFLSTPDGIESLDFLVDELKIPIVKVGSTEVTHPQLLRAVALKGLPIILSTGLSTLGEVEEAVKVIRLDSDAPLVLLHCTSEYPAPYNEINMRAMSTMANAFDLPVGYSDHSLGMEAAIASVAMGACVVEKHFTLDKKMNGPDHSSSLNPEELKSFVRSIRNASALLGGGIKKPSAAELKNLDGIRRSIVAAGDIPAGTILTKGMLACKRPGTGVAPSDEEKLIGKIVNVDLKEDQPFLWEYIKP